MFEIQKKILLSHRYLKKRVILLKSLADVFNLKFSYLDMHAKQIRLFLRH
jgi:hypothetical protein